MNKKNSVLPVSTLVLSVMAGMLMLVFTTSFVYNFYSITYDTLKYKTEIDYFDVVNRSGKFAEIAYKIDPSYSNLFVVSHLYDPTRVVHYINYLDDKDCLNKLPSDFTEKSVEYSKIYYDYLLDYYEQSKVNDSLPNINSLTYTIGTEQQVLFGYYSDYITALYLNGQKDEARKLVDEVINNYSSYEDAYVSYGLIDFVYLVHNTETDKDFQKWMLDNELRLTEEYNKKAIKEYQFENFYIQWNREDHTQDYKPFN